MRILFIASPTLKNQAVKRVLSENGLQVQLYTLSQIKRTNFSGLNASYDLTLIDLDSPVYNKDELPKLFGKLKTPGARIAVHNGWDEEELQPVLKAGFNDHISIDTPSEEWIQQIELLG